MKITRRTRSEKIAHSQRAKRHFALLPVSVADGDVRWLEWIWKRTVMEGAGMARYPMNQYRAAPRLDWFPALLFPVRPPPPMPKVKGAKVTRMFRKETPTDAGGASSNFFDGNSDAATHSQHPNNQGANLDD